MAEDHKEFMLNILEDLTKHDMSKLGTILNSKKIEGHEIPSHKLENLDAKKATQLFISYYEEPLKALEQSLCGIPRKDLVQKVRPKIETDEKKHEAQNNEKVALIKSCSGSNDRPLYTGKYTLVDLQDYATKNQDQLIMHLQNILEPDQFNALKKELICRVLKKDFSFTADKYYELFRNSELREFLKNNGKPKKIPMKLLEILFSKKKNNLKRKAQEQMQGEGNNLKKKPKKKKIPIHPMEHKSGNEINNVIEEHCLDNKITLGTENEKIIPIHPMEHKSGNEDNNRIEEHCLDNKITLGTENEKIIPIHPMEHKSGNEDNNGIEEHCLDNKITLGTENEKIIPIHPMEHKSGNEINNGIEEHCLDNKITLGTENEKIIPIHPMEHKSGNEDNNGIEEHWLDEDSRMAFENWYTGKKYREKISFNYIGIHEHQEYPCFIAVDVLQFRLQDDSDYHILAMQNERNFTKLQKLKKEAEFELQFNMAVLDVQFSEVISSKGFSCKIQANKSFSEYGFFLENIVSEIVLPVLALFKWVKLNAIKNANLKKQIFP